MSEIKKDKFAGGTGLTSEDGLSEDMRDVADDLAAVKAPVISAAAVSATAAVDAVQTAAADVVAVATPAPAQTVIADVSEHFGVVQGMDAGAPTTPSSQAVDPGGETDWNVNVSAGTAIVNDVGVYRAAAVDLNISTGVRILNIGEAVYAWLLEVEAGGVVTRTPILGVAALLGAETIPTDGDITTAVGHANWTKLALCHASRTADAVVATTENAGYKTPWGGAGSGLQNDLKAKYNVAVTAMLELRTLAGTIRTLANDLKAKYNANVTLVNEVKADLAEARAVANELRTDLNAINATTLKTTKG